MLLLKSFLERGVRPLRKSHVKSYSRTTASGRTVMVKEHDDSRTKKPGEAAAPRARRQGEDAAAQRQRDLAAQHSGMRPTGEALSRLTAHAEESKSPEEFDKNMKPGMGAMSIDQVISMIEENSDGDLSLGEIRKKLEAGGEHYLRMGMSNASLQGLKGVDDNIQIPNDYANDAPAIVANGEVIEGKFRVAAAVKNGGRLSVVMPAKEWYQRVNKGEGQGDDKKAPEKASQSEGKAKKESVETQLQDLPARLRQKCQRAAAGEGKEISLTKAEVYLLLERGVIGIISAGKNPNLEPDMKPEEEKKRHEELRTDLKQRGLMHMQVLGKYGGEEDSFMVFTPDIRKDELVEMGGKYNQDSVVFVDHGKNQMIFTTGENKGKHHAGQGYEKIDNKAEDYYTEFSDSGGGKSRFSLNFDWDSLKKAMRAGMLLLRKSHGRGGRK